jgi:hypothetical protein
MVILIDFYLGQAITLGGEDALKYRLHLVIIKI